MSAALLVLLIQALNQYCRCLERAEDLLLPHLAVFARLSLARFALRHGSLERPRPAAARRGGGGKGAGKVMVPGEGIEGSAAASMEVLAPNWIPS